MTEVQPARAAERLNNRKIKSPEEERNEQQDRVQAQSGKMRCNQETGWKRARGGEGEDEELGSKDTETQQQLSEGRSR